MQINNQRDLCESTENTCFWLQRCRNAQQLASYVAEVIYENVPVQWDLFWGFILVDIASNRPQGKQAQQDSSPLLPCCLKRLQNHYSFKTRQCVASPLTRAGNRKRLRARRSSSEGCRPHGDRGWMSLDETLEESQTPLSILQPRHRALDQKRGGFPWKPCDPAMVSIICRERMRMFWPQLES